MPGPAARGRAVLSREGSLSAPDVMAAALRLTILTAPSSDAQILRAHDVVQAQTDVLCTDKALDVSLGQGKRAALGHTSAGGHRRP